jgi:glycosyltransferase involved in cell wall biosynthesis
MRVLAAHNHYQRRGGEDTVVQVETGLLQEAGHEVLLHTVSNNEIVGVVDKIKAAVEIKRNKRAVAEFYRAVERFRPDVVHFHNTFPRLSLGAVEAALDLKIPTVMTLHNYRMICANAMFMRNGQVCEQCMGGSRWPAVKNACYRDTRLGSFLVGIMGREFRRIYDRHSGLRLIALTEFGRSRFLADGFSPERIFVKGNTCDNQAFGSFPRDRRIVFVGRVSQEKGVDFLVEVARGINAEFEIIGEGPLCEELMRRAPENVVMRGCMAREAAIERITTATSVVLPSRWYEGFPMVLVEAFSTGTPVVASCLGAMAELIADGSNGLTVPAGDFDKWREALLLLLENPLLVQQMGEAARRTYEQRYCAKRNVEELIKIYNDVIVDTR